VPLIKPQLLTGQLTANLHSLMAIIYWRQMLLMVQFRLRNRMTTPQQKIS